MNRVQRNLSSKNKKIGKENNKKKPVKLSYQELRAKKKSVVEILESSEAYKGIHVPKNESIKLVHNYKFFPCSKPLKQKSFNVRRDGRPVSVLLKSPKKVHANNTKVWSTYESGAKIPSPAQRSKTSCKNSKGVKYSFNRIKSYYQEMSQTPYVLSSFLIKSAEISNKDMKKNKMLPKIKLDSPDIHCIDENESNDEDSPYKYESLYLKPKFNAKK